MRLRPLLPPGFRLLSGDDATALAFIANGGDGCISTVSNVAPELCQAIFSNCRQGRLQTARYLHNRLAPLTAALSKESPAALKYALCLLGFMSPATRLPIVELADAAKAEVAGAIAAIGDEDLACPVESWHGRLLLAATPPPRRRGVSNEFKRSRHGMARQDAARLATGDAALRRDTGQCRQIGRHGDRGEIDGSARRAGRDDKPDFGFFRSTSAELCAAILQPNELTAAVLRQYLARIDDDRLKRAFAAAIETKQPTAPAVSKPAKRDNDLWKGLSARGNRQSRL